MKLSQLFDTQLLTVEELSKKYNVTKSVVEKELATGIRVEMEHTSHKMAARKIALAHLGEDLNYYKKLAKVEKKNLTEIFKRVEYDDWKYYPDGIIGEFYTIEFEIDNHQVVILLIKKTKNNLVTTIADLLPDNTEGYSISFSVDGKTGAWGNEPLKNAIQILSKVNALLLGKLQNPNNPGGIPWDFLYFSATGSRLADFYNKVAEKFADSFGGKLRRSISKSGFVILKKELNEKTSLLSESYVDNVHGLGNVPRNQDVGELHQPENHHGLKVMMKPSKFLDLAAYISREDAKSLDYISTELKNGKKIASPFLILSLPEKWEGGDYSESAKVITHEGRNRMMAIQDIHGDIPIETHLFFTGGLRLRHIKPEWLLEINKKLIPEKQLNPIQGPFFETQLNENFRLDSGKPVVKNATPQRLTSMIKNAQNHSLRGLIDGNDIYWWDSYDATHNEVCSLLGIGCPHKNRLYLIVGTRRYGDRLVLDTELSIKDMSQYPQLEKLIHNGIVVSSTGREELSENFVKIKLDSYAFRNWFGNSKVVDSEHNPLPVYHGAGRPDRVGSQFRKSRATAGPMAYFTENPETASGYATSKADTSLTDETGGYETWFKVKLPTFRNEINIDRAWYFLPSEERERIRQLAPRVTRDDQKDIYMGDKDHTVGLGGFESQIKNNKGNILKALVEEWLTSGALYADEEEFLTVLKMAGMTTPARFAHPRATTPFVYKVYLSIQNPLDTANVPSQVIDALDKAVRRQPHKKSYDSWNKNTIDAREWYSMLLDTKRSTYAWTVIPDWVTRTLESLGYDGIKDTGGKGGGEQHTVWIPFHENQVKSAISNVTFSQSKNIMKETGGVGLVVPGVNMTGIHKNEISRQAKKFGNKVSATGVPPVANTNGSDALKEGEKMEYKVAWGPNQRAATGSHIVTASSEMEAKRMVRKILKDTYGDYIFHEWKILYAVPMVEKQ